MPFYSSPDQFYGVMQMLFERVRLRETNPIDALEQSRLTIRFKLSDPVTEINVNGRVRPVQVVFGPANLQPDLDVQLTADNLHLILMHELPVKKALASGKMKVRGPMWRTLPLTEILSSGRLLYPGVLKDQGLG